MSAAVFHTVIAVDLVGELDRQRLDRFRKLLNIRPADGWTTAGTPSSATGRSTARAATPNDVIRRRVVAMTRQTAWSAAPAALRRQVDDFLLGIAEI